MLNSNNSVHTWHNITTSDSYWIGRLIISSANEQAYFTNSTGGNEGEIYDFKLSPITSPFTFGFGFENANFDVSYVLTLYENDAMMSAPQFSSNACQFDVSAKAPADPDIRALEYNGAKCNFTIVPFIGENFDVSA